MKNKITIFIPILAILSLTAHEVSAVVNPGPSAAGGAFSSFVTERFRTDLTTGAATASVPVIVPPGRKGIQPNLALSYSSNNGNSWCGVGWSLDVGAIQRSTKRGVPKYDNTDTFIFSGAEVVHIGNNEYRAKIESQFMRFLYDDTNDCWTVYDKGGTRYLFGATADSKIGNGTETFKWCLSRVIDLHFNYMTFHYAVDQNRLYLERIEYTGNEGAVPLSTRHSIVFGREARTDTPVGYRSGYPATTGQRLNNISVYTDNVLNWEYIIDYGYSTDTNRSLIRSVTLKDSQGNTLPPKTFTYQSGGGISEN